MVLFWHLPFRSTERFSDGVLKLFIFHEVGRPIECHDAVDDFRMQGCKRECPGSTHRTATKNDVLYVVLRLHCLNDLQHVCFCGRPHP